MKSLFLGFLAFAFFATLASVSFADELPRHGVLGVVVVPRDSSAPEDPKSNPPIVKTVFPGSAGEAAGIQPGDVLTSLDFQPVASSAEFARTVAGHLAGDSLKINFQRNGAPHSVTATLKPRPYETSPDADILYTSVSVNGSRRRVILTHPKAPGRYPAVLLMGGLGCYTLDGALSQEQGYGPILAFLAKNNFVTARVEKTGQGDSEGPACTDPRSTADREAQGYVRVMPLLESSEFVDPANIFVFAHSLGPLIGSLVVAQLPIRGFIAAETIGRSWFEYEVENVRRQSALTGDSYDKVEKQTREHTECAYHFFILHETAEQVRKLNSDCSDMLGSYAGVPFPYMQQIGDINLAKQWQTVDVSVLVIYGTSDPVTSASESRYLVDLINNFHPGRATYAELPNMGHDFATYSTPAEFLARNNGALVGKPHPFDQTLLTTVLTWLRQNQHPI